MVAISAERTYAQQTEKIAHQAAEDTKEGGKASEKQDGNEGIAGKISLSKKSHADESAGIKCGDRSGARRKARKGFAVVASEYGSSRKEARAVCR